MQGNSPDKNEKRWFALYVASRQEKNACRLLMEKGVEAYVPLVKTMRQWSDRKKMVEFPMLNGYLFVKISAFEKESALQTKGIVCFVRSEGRDAEVREEEIGRLKQLEQLGYHVEANPYHQKLHRGDKITITSGPLKGCMGFIVSGGEKANFEILLESIGYSLRVKLPAGLLKVQTT